MPLTISCGSDAADFIFQSFLLLFVSHLPLLPAIEAWPYCYQAAVQMPLFFQSAMSSLSPLFSFVLYITDFLRAAHHTPFSEPSQVFIFRGFASVAATIKFWPSR